MAMLLPTPAALAAEKGNSGLSVTYEDGKFLVTLPGNWGESVAMLDENAVAIVECVYKEFLDYIQGKATPRELYDRAVSVPPVRWENNSTNRNFPAIIEVAIAKGLWGWNWSAQPSVGTIGAADILGVMHGKDTSDDDKLKLAWLCYVGTEKAASWVFDDKLPGLTGAISEVLTTDLERANANAQEVLGERPESDPFKQDEWDARSYIITGKGQMPETFSGDYTELQKLYLRSIYQLRDYNAPSMSGTVSQFGAASPIDVATATYALRTYNSLDRNGALETQKQRMQAWTYKLQATMGLAAGVLGAADRNDTSGTSVTQEEIDNFLRVAYGTSLAPMHTSLFGLVSYPRSRHLGNTISQLYYYYLVVCYQEFGYYATTLVQSMGEVIVNGLDTFSGHKDDILAFKTLYEGVSWANDQALWEFWDTDIRGLTFEGSHYKNCKSVYDYLLSNNAFEAIVNYDPAAANTQFRYFFGTDGSGKFQLSDNIQTGIVASASYIPMHTNLYDPYTFTDLVDASWLLNFHAKFGYNRKALYIDTNVDAALNYQRTGTKGTLRVCTLEDLLYADKDIVLYLDDNLYNVKTLAELLDKAFDRLDNVDGESSTRTWWQKIGDAIVGLWDVSMENIAKTAEVTTYSTKVRNAVENSKWKNFFLNNAEDADPEDQGSTAYYLKPDDLWDAETNSIYKEEKIAAASTYSPLTAFAVISAIYHEPDLLDALNTTLNKNTPVFISSPTVPYLKDARAAERNIIYNYLLLKNLDSQMTIDYATNLDMTSPVYMDLYGNIVTESGLVVVPAAANATLWADAYIPYNAAFYSTYGDDHLLEYTEKAESLRTTLAKTMTPVEGYWRLTSVRVNNGTIDISKLSTADKDSLGAISEVLAYDLSTGLIYQKDIWQMIITEVLRGAPIEHIDKDFEGLNLSHRVTKSGLVVAEKLEFLVEALSAAGTNTTLAIPNPAYMDGIEYVVFFAFKLLILCILVIWMLTIYADAVGNGGLSLRTGTKCIWTVVLVLSLIVGVPLAFELSYYHSNKLLLQEETEYMMMLNLEKRESGQEIGVTSIHEPDTTTTLYLKIADVDIPWYDLLPKIVTSSSASNLGALYAEYEGQHPIASAEGMTVLNDAVYVSTDQLFDSSTITFSSTTKTLYQLVTEDTPASYYTPYYFFLEQIIYKANYWVHDNNYYAYTTKLQRGGKLKTLGYIQPYFMSEDFMQEGMDYFGLYTLYDVTPPTQYYEKAFSNAVLSATRFSQWCNMDISENAKISRIEKLNAYAREWIAENRELMGKVTDETFLKCFALSCAMEHNRLFNTMRADALEIYELSNEDLTRLSIADKNTVMNGSVMSYARFVFNVGGTPAVYAAALLTLVSFISSWMKPLATLLVFLITCISIFIFKLILRRHNNSIYGYICTIMLMCTVNVLGSVFLKLSMYIPRTGLSPTVCILIQILIQCAYIYLLLWIVRAAMKDWKNVGFDKYNAVFNKITRHQNFSVDVDTPTKKNGWEYYNALVERQRRRHKRL